MGTRRAPQAEVGGAGVAQRVGVDPPGDAGFSRPIAHEAPGPAAVVVGAQVGLVVAGCLVAPQIHGEPHHIQPRARIEHDLGPFGNEGSGAAPYL